MLAKKPKKHKFRLHDNYNSKVKQPFNVSRCFAELFTNTGNKLNWILPLKVTCLPLPKFTHNIALS